LSLVGWLFHVSLHSTLIAGVVTPLLMDTAGQSIEVRVKGEDAPRTMTALVSRERTIEKQVGHTRRQYRQRRVGVTNDEAGRFGGIEALPMNAIVTIDGIDYSIQEKPSVLDGLICANVQRSAVEEKAGQGYRG
jgi:hypothetical protein